MKFNSSNCDRLSGRNGSRSLCKWIQIDVDLSRVSSRHVNKPLCTALSTISIRFHRPSPTATQCVFSVHVPQTIIESKWIIRFFTFNFPHFCSPSRESKCPYLLLLFVESIRDYENFPSFIVIVIVSVVVSRRFVPRRTSQIAIPKRNYFPLYTEFCVVYSVDLCTLTHTHTIYTKPTDLNRPKRQMAMGLSER